MTRHRHLGGRCPPCGGYPAAIADDCVVSLRRDDVVDVPRRVAIERTNRPAIRIECRASPSLDPKGEPGGLSARTKSLLAAV